MYDIFGNGIEVGDAILFKGTTAKYNTLGIITKIPKEGHLFVSFFYTREQYTRDGHPIKKKIKISHNNLLGDKALNVVKISADMFNFDNISDIHFKTQCSMTFKIQQIEGVITKGKIKKLKDDIELAVIDFMNM